MSGTWSNYRQATGNGSLIVLVDSSYSVGSRMYSYRPWTMFHAIEHFGMPYRILDLRERELNRDDVSSSSGVIIAQHGIGRGISSEGMQALIDGIHEGMGMINFDDDAESLQGMIGGIFGISGNVSRSETDSAIVHDDGHYITSTRDLGERIAFKRPIGFARIGCLSPSTRTILRSPEGDPIVLATRHGKGRMVQFALSPHVWLSEYFGFGEGLDDVFWKSIVWAARKPFCMNAMPPFVTCRIDDCSGSSSPLRRGDDSAVNGFKYIDALNEHGFIPNIGLFIDEISEDDSRKIKEKHDAGLAEFSAHAFEESREEGEEVTRFIYHRTHGVELTDTELAENFAKLDGIYGRWGISPSRVVNSHYQNPGLRALRFLKERGQTYMMFGGLFGKTYSDPGAYMWQQMPYGHPGYVFDNIPITDGKSDVRTGDFFCALSHPYKKYPDGKISDGDIDCLSGNVISFNESPFNNLEAAARKAVVGIKRGLDNLFFGCLFTHEQRIAALSLKEWEAILKKVDELTSKHVKIYKGYDYIAEYAKNRCSCWVSESSFVSNTIRCKFEGRSEIPLQLYLFLDSDEGVKWRFEIIPAFTGSITVTATP